MIVTVENFEEQFSEIENSIKEAKLISVDLEFSALHPLKTPSLFDNPSERYSKLKTNLSQVIPIQVGITTFNFNPNNNSYHGKTYNFYVLPAAFPTVQRGFYFQSDTIGFLKIHKFDFNKLVFFGIPFINRQQEIQLRERLQNESITENQCSYRQELEKVFANFNEIVKKWFCEAKEGDCLSLPKVFEEYRYNYEMLYFIHKYFRRSFKYVWSTTENNEFVLQRVTEKEYKVLHKSSNLEDELVSNLLGFTKIFRLITNLKKPIVGHNLLQDLLLLITSFETQLPNTYTEFKKLTSCLFPTIFDTKTISYELKKIIPEEKMWPDSSLEALFKFFKDGIGRHLVINSPAITLEENNNYGNFHEAGWDSFCAGYIFIRLAYLNVYHKFPKSKTFMSGELIGGLSDLKNRVNVIRGTVSSIKIDGEDPESTRPPYLVIESIKNPVDISQISSILSSFGFVEVRKLPYQKRRVLIAVDNFSRIAKEKEPYSKRCFLRYNHRDIEKTKYFPGYLPRWTLNYIYNIYL